MVYIECYLDMDSQASTKVKHFRYFLISLRKVSTDLKQKFHTVLNSFYTKYLMWSLNSVMLIIHLFPSLFMHNVFTLGRITSKCEKFKVVSIMALKFLNKNFIVYGRSEIIYSLKKIKDTIFKWYLWAGIINLSPTLKCSIRPNIHTDTIYNLDFVHFYILCKPNNIFPDNFLIPVKYC